jgi:flagellar biosynthesis protein FlhF
MQIKKFSGSNINMIYKRIKSELGSDAILLYERVIERRPLLKFWEKKKEYEVLAGVGFNIVKEKASQNPQKCQVKDLLIKKYGEVDNIGPRTSFLTMLRQEILELKTLLTDTKNRFHQRRLADSPKALFDEYLALVGNLVSDELSRRLIREIEKTLNENDVKNPCIVRNATRLAIQNLIAFSDGIDIERKAHLKVLFMGPTGVGKTTTIAKLAAIYKYKYGCSIGIITNDTYRIAATTQIVKIAERLDIPVIVAPLPEDVKVALKQFTDMNIVLIDTAGRPQRNKQKMDELRSIITAAQPDEVHLVLSVTSHIEILQDIITQFADYKFDKIILTKLDEAVKFGIILDVMSRMEAKLSFVTTGQEIPKDIEVADPERLAKLILGEETIYASQ